MVIPERTAAVLDAGGVGAWGGRMEVGAEDGGTRCGRTASVLDAGGGGTQGGGRQRFSMMGTATRFRLGNCIVSGGCA